jgi:hypothetical protein
VRQLPAAIARASYALGRHQLLLWWLHSAWALAWGIVFMWLGQRHFEWLRLAFVYIALIWISHLLLPLIQSSPRLSDGQQRFAARTVAYFHRNFYQQLVFFVLPIYAASVTWDSPNVLFLFMVAASALLSTLDVLYDRHVWTRRPVWAAFFAFNLFVCANVALPILWGVATVRAMRLSAALALAGFLTLRFGPRDLRIPAVRRSVIVTAAALALLVEGGRPLIPPAPLQVVSTRFGLGFDRSRLEIAMPLSTLDAAFSGRVYALSAVRAPAGLRDRLRHRWVEHRKELYRSAFHDVSGGRTRGFRLWTSAVVTPERDVTTLDVWVETEGGQIVGRARLPIRATAGR